LVVFHAKPTLVSSLIVLSLLTVPENTCGINDTGLSMTGSPRKKTFGDN